MYPTSKVQTNVAENVEKYFHVPATAEDSRKLKENRATVWPSVWVTVLLIAVIIALGVYFFGWVPVVIVVVAIAIIGVACLLGFGMAHDMGEEGKKASETVLPGCDVFDPSDVRMTGGKVYELDCAPSDIYPYLAQMNLTKAGFYSFQHFERFFGFHIRNDYTIRPEWQKLNVGDWMYYHQKGAGTGIVDFKENEYIVTYTDTRYKPTQELAIAWTPKWMPDGFAWTWNFIFLPLDGGERTRFVSNLQAWWPESMGKATLLRLLVQWAVPSNFMMNGMACKMGRLAEADARARRAGKPRPGYNYTK